MGSSFAAGYGVGDLMGRGGRTPSAWLGGLLQTGKVT
jgi:hypothetical protein